MLHRNMLADSPMNLSETFQRALASSGLDHGQKLAREITQTVQQALASSGLPGLARTSTEPTGVADIAARFLPATTPTSAPTLSGPGTFTDHTFHSAHGSRHYKLYITAAAHAGPRPLVVMLHGCQQNPDDFAAGTRMNLLAEAHGFLVCYPEQSRNDHGANCWNWFRVEDQARDSGEPALIAGMVQEVIAGHPVDPGRVFVAGLSAGAAMAVILGQTWPELFKAVGAHSGLPYGAAHDVGSAFAAMSGPGTAPRRGAAPKGLTRPVIVFHGDHDTTVNARNGDAIVTQAVAASDGLHKSVQRHAASGARDCTTTVYADAEGRPKIEHWLVHGAGHAWSGGHAGGSFTEAGGPDASAQMLRFFLAQG